MGGCAGVSMFVVENSCLNASKLPFAANLHARAPLARAARAPIHSAEDAARERRVLNRRERRLADFTRERWRRRLKWAQRGAATCLALNAGDAERRRDERHVVAIDRIWPALAERVAAQCGRWIELTVAIDRIEDRACSVELVSRSRALIDRHDDGKVRKRLRDGGDARFRRFVVDGAGAGCKRARRPSTSTPLLAYSPPVRSCPIVLRPPTCGGGGGGTGGRGGGGATLPRAADEEEKKLDGGRKGRSGRNG